MPSGANVQFKRGLLANMPVSVIDGTIYVTTDEHAMYVDNGNQRIRIGDFIPVNTINDLPIAGHAYETAVYYVKTGNILARWDKTNSRWIQINKAGVVGVTLASNSPQDGNVVSEITTTTADDGTLRLVITKAKFPTATQLADLTERVETLEGTTSTLESAVQVINGDVNTSGSILNLIDAARTALLGGETTYTTFKTIGDALRSLIPQVSTLSQNYADLEPRVAANEDAITILNGDATVTGSVRKTVAEAIAEVVASAPSDFDTLKEIADWIASHGQDAATLQSTVGQLVTKVSTLESSQETQDADISDLKTRMTAAESDIDDLEAAVNTLNGTASTPGSVANSIASAIAPISTRLADAEENAADAIDRLTWKEFDENT